MADSVENALLIDGATLVAATRPLSRAPEAEPAPAHLRSWSFGASEEFARADAFAQAVADCPVEGGAPLALPPDILVTRVISLPAADAESLASMVRLKMEKFAPVADDDLEVDYEVIGASESQTRVFAVAVPVATLDAWAADLEVSGLALPRIDSSLLCEWRSLSQWLEKTPAPARHDGTAAQAGRTAAIVALPSGRYDFIAADETGPIFARTLGSALEPEDLSRELTLSLLDIAAETPDFAPERAVVVTPAPLEPRFASAIASATGLPPEVVSESALRPYVECALDREAEEGCIDIVPSAWRDDERAATAKRNFIYGAVAAVVLWAALFAALMIIPRSIGRQTDALRAEIAAIMPDYGDVADTRTRVRLIQSYEDRSHSALETLRLLCERLPDGVTVGNFAYDRNDESSGRRGPGGVKVAGDAADSDAILRLKGPSMDGQRRRFKFDLDWRFAEGGE